MDTLRFEPFTATFSTTFWKRLTQLKIDKLRLQSSEPIRIWGTFQAGSIKSSSSPLVSPLYFDHESFNEAPTTTQGLSIIYGNLYLFDTIESFRSFDRVALSKRREVELRTSSLSFAFDGIVFADLKKYRFYYHFAHPVLAPSKDAGIFGVSRVQEIPLKVYESAKLKAYQNTFFEIDDETAITFAHLDASHLHSDAQTADWTVRQFLMSMALEGKHSTVDLILLRDSHLASVRLSISIPKISQSDAVLVAGWERNAQGKIAPSSLDLAPLLDPLQYIILFD